MKPIICKRMIVTFKNEVQHGPWRRLGPVLHFILECGVVHSILRNNVPSQVFATQVESAQVTFSNVQGGISGVGNIDVEESFVDLANGDFRLLAMSPSIDSGTPDNAPARDLDGNWRPAGAGGDGPTVAVVLALAFLHAGARWRRERKTRALRG